MSQSVKLTEEALALLFTRLESRTLTDEDVQIIKDLFDFNEWLQDQLANAKLSIKSLRQLFGFKQEKQNKITNKKNTEKNDNTDLSFVESSNDNNHSTTVEPNKSENDNTQTCQTKWCIDANHGRLGANAYTGCSVEPVPFSEPFLKDGYCPECAKHNTQAKLNKLKKCSPVILLYGTPLINGTRYDREKARCSVCQQYFTATLPGTLNSSDKYDVTCKSAIAINHYFAGLPFSRLDTLQAAQGIPLPDATQYELMSVFYYDIVEPMKTVLEKYAANGDGVYGDDTTMRLIEQISLNKKADNPNDKRAIHGTVLLSCYQGHNIYLYQTDTRVAGQVFTDLFKQRDNDKAFFTMTDASHHNTPSFKPDLMVKWILCYCLVHGRRQFYNLINANGLMDPEVKLVLDIIANVYDNERWCKNNQLSPKERLAYHQRHSQPLMKSLKIWLNNCLLYSKVEPNSPLGKAIAYMLKHFDGLTRFLTVPGVPIDNNVAEQAIKVLIRYRNNSLFYKTAQGAKIGDGFMSLLQTAHKSGVNLFDYLNTLQRYRDEVNQYPERWLPWCYQETVATLMKKAA